MVSWCLGHLAEYAAPEHYDERYENWRFEDLPILPVEWKLLVHLSLIHIYVSKSVNRWPNPYSGFHAGTNLNGFPMLHIEMCNLHLRAFPVVIGESCLLYTSYEALD